MVILKEAHLPDAPLLIIENKSLKRMNSNRSHKGMM
jgi:hypothetical protein